MIVDGQRCAGCGYYDEYHDLGTRRCPIETADVNGRRGTFREDVPVPRRDWHGLQKILSEAELKAALIGATRREPEGPRTPQVPARPPLRPEEIAGGGKNAQATKLGRIAMAADWSVSALYWRDAGGVEGCGVWLAKEPLRALALWKRAAGQVGAVSGWLVDIAYAWRTDAERMPTKLTHTDLGRLIK